MQLSPKDIEQVATLARLALSEQEKKHYADQLSVVFDYIEMLNEVDVNDVPETTQVTGLADVFREDEAVPAPADRVKKIREQFPEGENGYLKVKAVFEM